MKFNKNTIVKREREAFTMKRKLLTLALAIALTVGLVPAMAEPAMAASSKTGISDISDSTYNALALSTESEELLEQAKSILTPYGKGYASLLTTNELMFINHRGEGDSYNISTSGSVSFSKSGSSSHDLGDADAYQSVAFDPMGSGKADYIATVSAKEQDGDTEIRLTIDTTEKDPSGKDIKSISVKLCDLPFKVYPENAGAWLSIAAGNFDGDDYNTQEIAVYNAGGIPWFGDTQEAAGSILIYSVKKNIKKELRGSGITPTYVGAPKPQMVEKFLGIELKSRGALSLRSKSSYYFYDNSKLYRERGTNGVKMQDWKYQYRFPAVSIETVKQPNSAADDLAIAFTATLGGKKAKTSAGANIKASRPYDCATGVFFWMDPVNGIEKTTPVRQMRYNWRNDYKVNENLDDKAEKKYDVMVFGSPGAGDINADGLQEVVVGGYLLDNRDQVMDGSDESDWKISDNEYVATYFTYDADEDTYELVNQPMSWIGLKKGEYKGASNLGGGIYDTYGDKDMVQHPLAVTCFAEKGPGYGESIALGGIVTYLDTEGTSKWLPYDAMNAAIFSDGVFNPRYAIPLEYIHDKNFEHGINNRLITESVAGNFDGNALGQEQLAFSYLAKRDGKSQWCSVYGIIGQKKVGEPDFVGNIDKKDKKYLDSDIRFNYWISSKWKAKNGCYASVCAADTDKDSIIMRYTGEPNEYFFSDPKILAVLQASPYFKDVEYVDAGETSVQYNEGHTNQMEHGLTVGLQVQAGGEIGLPLIGQSKLMAGVSSEFNRTWGESTTKTYSLNYSAGLQNSVALVMTPYVRYHYETYDTASKKWIPMIVDSPQSPRASIITVEKYDQVAAMEKWEKIGGNILNNIAGYPATYDKTKAKKKNFESGKAVGAKTASNFVKVGSGDSAGSMSQTISVEDTKFVNMSWTVKEVMDVEKESGGMVISVSQSAGYTGASSKADFTGHDYVGEVTNIPSDYEDYSFSWLFGCWEGKVKVDGKDDSFAVLGYLVKDVMQPPTYPDNFHASESDSKSITLVWKSPDGVPTLITTNSIYTLFRYQHGVYYPLISMKNSESKDGWFSYTETDLNPFAEYMYAIQTTSKQGYQTVESPYSPILHAYTISGDSNIPQVSIDKNSLMVMENGSATLKAKVKAATIGKVGAAVTQWQKYDRDKGGWSDVKGNGAKTDTLTIYGYNAADMYRCRVSQKIGADIITVYSTAAEVEVIEKAQATQPKVTVNVPANTEIGYAIITGGRPSNVNNVTHVWHTKTYSSYSAGTQLTLLVLDGEDIAVDFNPSIDTPGDIIDGYAPYTFTVPSSGITIDLTRATED